MDQRLDHEYVGHELGRESTNPVDFAFLATQTFSDDGLAQELLDLFLAQARRLVPALPNLPCQAQADAAHLLKGSALGIGAFAAAAASRAYEATPARERPRAYPALAAAFGEAEAAIAAHMANG